MPHFFGRRVGDRVEIRGPDARHLAGPLRARPGERIMVVESEGRLLTVELTVVGAALAAGRVVEDVAYDPEPRLQVVLGLSLLPAASLDDVLARGTEIGAAGFVLVEAGRSQARGSRPERWARICREAAMLAGRLRVPEVVGPLRFAEAWAAAGAPLLLDRAGPRLPLAPDRLDWPVTLFIGPEGGWEPGERALAGSRVTSLGPRNLRAGTAALVALSVALAGDA